MEEEKPPVKSVYDYYREYGFLPINWGKPSEAYLELIKKGLIGDRPQKMEGGVPVGDPPPQV